MANFKKTLSGGTHIVTASSGVQMVMLVRNRKEYFTNFIEREAKAQGLKVVINGSFVDLSFGSKVAVRMGDSPLDASDSSPVGQVIQEGKLLTGSASTGKFSFSQETCGTEKFTAKLGNPAPSSCAAVGGIAPIIINGMPYGANNAYKAGVPENAPLTGDVGEEFAPFLTQKSNAMFAAMLARGEEVGKTAIGYSSSRQKLYILVQENRKAGCDANGIRTIFLDNYVNNAVFMDGSDSATLYYDGKFLATPGTDKNEFLTVALGFK